MYDSDGERPVSRRTLLRASAGSVALSSVGSARAGGDGDSAAARQFGRGCPEATIEPGMAPCEGTSEAGCADDHPTTTDLRAGVADSLETRFPDAGALIDAGFRPYFDTLETGDDSWSHWLQPEFIGDDGTLDAERPESVLVDNETWRTMGVMFIATRGGDPVDSPPAVYEDDAGRCSPWHAHTGLPGRFAWWYYQQVYDRGSGVDDLAFPCRTPCMLHVWAVDHPESVYAHDAPPREYRDLAPAGDPGFETDAVPGEDSLGWDALPDDLVPERTPDEFSVPGPAGIDFGP